MLLRVIYSIPNRLYDVLLGSHHQWGCHVPQPQNNYRQFVADSTSLYLRAQAHSRDPSRARAQSSKSSVRPTCLAHVTHLEFLRSNVESEARNSTLAWGR